MRWAIVADTDGWYEVSDTGLARSKDRRFTYADGRNRLHEGKLLKLGISPGGYQTFGVCVAGRSRTLQVHVAVAESFLGPRPGWATLVRHLNGVKTDNRVGNLDWGTKSSNGLDSVRHGTHANANKTHCNRGHEYTPENTRIVNRVTTTARYCRVCDREREHRYYMNKKARECKEIR